MKAKILLLIMLAFFSGFAICKGMESHKTVNDISHNEILSVSEVIEMSEVAAKRHLAEAVSDNVTAPDYMTIQEYREFHIYWGNVHYSAAVYLESMR